MGEIITRGKLPHWYVPHAAHFVTYRLAGTLPAEVLQSLRDRKAELLRRPIGKGRTEVERLELVHKLVFADYDRFLDGDQRIDWLLRPAVASLIRGNLYYHNGSKYHLLAYCVMPNHVHVLFIPIVGDAASVAYEDCGEQADGCSPLAAIMHSLKSYTANQANAILGRSGAFWQKESYDHWVRDEDELERIVAYINANPVKAGLAKSPHEWYFGSAHDRFLYDGELSGLLGDIS
jgi:putative transposase